jgi:hypothetical protein
VAADDSGVSRRQFRAVGHAPAPVGLAGAIWRTHSDTQQRGKDLTSYSQHKANYWPACGATMLATMENLGAWPRLASRV